MTITPEQAEKAFADYALVIGFIAQNSAAIAHARRTLFLAYLMEGFSEGQALELCKVMQA
jgi:hypothetical protein